MPVRDANWFMDEGAQYDTHMTEQCTYLAHSIWKEWVNYSIVDSFNLDVVNDRVCSTHSLRTTTLIVPFYKMFFSRATTLLAINIEDNDCGLIYTVCTTTTLTKPHPLTPPNIQKRYEKHKYQQLQAIMHYMFNTSFYSTGKAAWICLVHISTMPTIA
jgi:hypothetical protein